MSPWGIKCAVIVLILLAPAAGSAIQQAKAQRGGEASPTTAELKTDSLRPQDDLAPGKGDRTVMSGRRILASDVLGQQLRGRDGIVIGRISDVVLTENLNGLAAIVEVGGILGLGGRTVAVPAGAIEVSRDAEGHLALSAGTTREQLLTAPVFDRTVLMR